jgi:hypothetical protein
VTESPWPARVGIIAVLVVLIVAGTTAWIAFRMGQRSAGHDAAAEGEQRSALQDHLDKVEYENQTLHARVAELEMARRLDRDAYGQIERTLGDLQSQLARQGDDLAFYRSIVSPADGVQGLRIQRLDVQAGAKPREYTVRLTLVQAMRHESVVSGLAQITINGMRGEVPTKYTLGELVGTPRAQLPFSLRYFQTLEQRVELPDGFDPYEVDVRLQSSKVTGPIEQTFQWKMGRQAAL